MATKKTSQAQQKALPSPFAVPGLGAYRALMDGQRERFEQLATELDKMEQERHARALSAIDEMTGLLKSSVEYQLSLAAEWREIALETARRAAEASEGPAA